MSKMILGRKLGMTQIFDANGRRIPVTVVQAGPMVVVAKKSAVGKDGYSAVQVGFEKADKQEKDGDVRYRGLGKAEAGVFLKAGLEPHRIVREFRVTEGELDTFNVGDTIDHSLFAEGTVVDVSATSKGRGFSGVMKRHNFKGFRSSHGVHESYRGGGSIGASAYPSHVFRGTRMAGQHGNVKATVQNVRIVRVLADEGIYLIRGAVPGATGALVEIKNAVKKRR